MPDLHLTETISCGQPQAGGNLLGIQPFMLPPDYASAQALFEKLAGYFDTARGLGWLSEKTVVVLPEYLGTWLVAAGEKGGIYAAASLKAAMQALITHNALRFARAYTASRERERVTAALFRMKAAAMARDYQWVFSRLASTYGVTLVAGSILLPQPTVENGSLAVGKGPLQNVSAVFRPDGSPHPQLSRKICPTKDELPFIAGAPVEQLPVFDTPAGRLGVLVCADSWFPEPYEYLRQKQVELLAVPSFAFGFGLMGMPWGGYSGAAAPVDVDPADVGRLTEAQAWQRYAMVGRMRESGARAGVNVFLRGQIWDAGSDSGDTVAVCGEEVTETHAAGAALLNCWL